MVERLAGLMVVLVVWCWLDLEIGFELDSWDSRLWRLNARSSECFWIGHGQRVYFEYVDQLEKFGNDKGLKLGSNLLRRFLVSCL